MNNVHTPRYDVGSRARLVCISRRGRSTGLFPITGTARRQRYRAIGLSGYRARLALAGERKTIARWQGDGDVGDTPPSHRSPLCIRFRSCRLSSTLVQRCRSRHFALSVLHELALEIELSDRPVVNRVVESEMCRELKTTWLTYFRSLEFSPPPPLSSLRRLFYLIFSITRRHPKEQPTRCTATKVSLWWKDFRSRVK